MKSVPIRGAGPRSLADLRPGTGVVLAGFDLPETSVARLMAVGFVPGLVVTARGAAPGGDPLIFAVDGALLAVRRETARHMRIAELSDVARDAAPEPEAR